VVVRPGEKGMVLHTMYYSDEVRRSEEFRTDVSNVSEKEMNLAKMLVESLAAEFEPEKYHDTYRTNLRKMIDAKIEGQAVVETPEEKIAPVIDIMEALKRSLEARKGPKVATAAAGQSIELSADEVEAQPKSKRARKVRTA